MIFDFFGTLACGPEGAVSGYAAVFERHGYRFDPAVEADHFSRYDGIEHLEHSTDKATYEAWVRSRHTLLAEECGVLEAAHVERIVGDIRALDTGRMFAYPETAETLAALRARGLVIGVCSNWGWELDASIAGAGLTALVDHAVTSAQAGARKPHPRIYAAITETLGVRPDEAVFVGDSLRPDVVGPLEFGMTAAHIWRGDRPGEAPELPEGARRIVSLAELLDWPALEGAGPLARAGESSA